MSSNTFFDDMKMSFAAVPVAGGIETAAFCEAVESLVKLFGRGEVCMVAGVTGRWQRLLLPDGGMEAGQIPRRARDSRARSLTPPPRDGTTHSTHYQHARFPGRSLFPRQE